MKDEILQDFKKNHKKLESFREKIEILIKELLVQASIPIHQISSRTKDYESLSKKIDKKQGKYSSIGEITDIVGIRLITYMESDVDRVAKLIESEFIVDKENSIDKRLLETDQFGYRSLHMVVSLNSARCALTEYAPYVNQKCEIQIRSILQHAWAEIEHDLGYKGAFAIPETYVRSFNRLSALLESADIEFDRLKKELVGYERDVTILIKEKPQDVAINQASLYSFMSTNLIIEEAAKIIMSTTGASMQDSNDYQGILSRFRLFNINTIKELEDSLLINKNLFFAFIPEFVGSFKTKKMNSSVTIFYFQHFLASQSKDPLFVDKYCKYESPVIVRSKGREDVYIDSYRKAEEIVKQSLPLTSAKPQ